MPRSRSRSFESITRSATRWLSRKAPDCCSSRSTRVVLPWSTWAMMATLRSFICVWFSKAAAAARPLGAPSSSVKMTGMRRRGISPRFPSSWSAHYTKERGKGRARAGAWVRGSERRAYSAAAAGQFWLRLNRYNALGEFSVPFAGGANRQPDAAPRKKNVKLTIYGIYRFRLYTKSRWT